MLSVGAIRFENRFCAVLLSRQVLCYIAKGAVSAGCRKALVVIGATISLLSTHGYGNCFSACRGSISGSFHSRTSFAGQRALTIVSSSLMSGCGQGHKPQEKNLWLKFPVLAYIIAA